ncbi:uncharacterized protein LOC131803668 [Musca domestica]|uniref:Uncharacterized protein LOC131803668 n=1 Tax=Musca domestica TaxID=7370 RepID=A0ABM3V5Q3_MUSDO|nr:uncharacterized protein LOC131803668 [Musca domestica]
MKFCWGNISLAWHSLACVLLGIRIASSSDLIQFGTSSDQVNPAEYYALADGQYPNVGPTEELKRTQRSFWTDLFSRGIFADRECTANCRIDAGDGSTPNDFPQPFQPFPQLPPWRPFQPLFGGNCQRCVCPECEVSFAGNPANSYNSDNNNYGDGTSVYRPSDESEKNTANHPISNNYVPTQEEKESYSITTQPTDSGNLTENTTQQVQYESNGDSAEDHYTKNSLPGEQSDEPGDISKSKVPQILYQPIIYVTSQFQEHAKNLIGPKSVTLGVLPPPPQSNNVGGASLPEYDTVTTPVQADFKQSLVPLTSYSEDSNCNEAVSTNAGEHCQGFHYAHPQYPSIPSVSTLYAVISPQQTAVHTIDCNRLYHNEDNAGPAKYSLATNFYDNNQRHHPVPPITLTCDDQPYRVCPELFEDYNRQLNKHNSWTMASSAYPCNPKNTFINAQLISY